MSVEPSWWLLPAFCCIGVPALAGDCTSGEGPEKSWGVDVGTVIYGLPWKLGCSITPVTNRKEGVAAAIRYGLVSVGPVQDVAPQMRLRADLTVTRYTGARAAAAAWSEIRETADPDTGLSYAWDYLELQAEIIYQLHAGCVISEDGFDLMVDNLQKQLTTAQGEVRQALRCRCGGGCRAYDTQD